MRDFLSLSGRAAVVTGGARGIGYAIAGRLLAAGASVVLADRDAEAAAKAAARLGEGAVAHAADMTREEDVRSLMEATVARFGTLDILVNNAGITGASVPLWEQTDAEWARVMDVNLTAVFRTCRAAVPVMRAQKRGAIVNVASIAGKEGNPNLVPYSASKAAVIALTKALAKEVIHDGVRVNAVAPAVIETELLAQMTPEVVAQLTARIPMGRVGKPEEVAAVVHFLCSDDAGFVTGQCYDASGGRATY
jgi:Dehydrogenases with different specificities (related to short-chain alcohol dehydrogenases)